MDKFQRNFRITINLDDGTPIVLHDPLTCKFTTTIRAQSSLNECRVEIYNLGKNYRELIFQEFYGHERKKTFTLEAGYGGMYATIYKGDIFEAYSERQDTNVITSIYGKSGDWEVKNSLIFETFNKGTKIRDLIEYLCKKTGLKVQAIGDFPDEILKPISINGQSYEYVKKYSNENVGVNNDEIYVLQQNENIENPSFPIITSDTGLLGTPRRDGGFLRVRMLFEPRLVLNQLVHLQSTIAPIYNGDYKVVGIQHQGTISQAVGGQCETMVDLFIGNRTWKTVPLYDQPSSNT